MSKIKHVCLKNIPTSYHSGVSATEVVAMAIDVTQQRIATSGRHDRGLFWHDDTRTVAAKLAVRTLRDIGQVTIVRLLGVKLCSLLRH